MLATAYDSLGMQADRIRTAAAAPEVALGAFQIGALVMPIGAIAVSLFRTGRMATRGLLTWSRGSVPRRAAALAAMAAAIGAAAYTWWPNGDYQPIRPGERGTVGEALASLPDAPTGRAAFTPGRAVRFASMPTVRQLQRSGTSSSPAPRRAAPVGSAPPGGNGAGFDDGTTDPTGDAGSGTVAPDPTGTPAPSATPPPAATVTPSPTQATATPTPTPGAAATPSPTDTPTPTSTSTATASPAPVAASTPTPTPTPTLPQPTP
jgi:hypothetical protein